MKAPDAVQGRGAKVIFVPPPLYYGAGLAIGMMLQSTVPLTIGARPGSATLGVLLLGAGLVLDAGGVVGVVRHHTTIVPHHAVSALVTTGAYRICRNPMYAGLALAYAGVALLAATWWPLIMLPLVLALVQRLVIAPEERYLADRFGHEYSDYRARVRRWI